MKLTYHRPLKVSPRCMGVRWRIWHLNHIKVICEVHVVWPPPFNPPGLRGVAARAGSVHLISSMDREGQAMDKQHHPVSRTIIFNQVPTGHRMSIGSPQSIPIKTAFSRPFCHTAHTRAHLISCVSGVTTHHHNHIHFKPSSASIQPYGPLSHTGVQCLINWRGLIFDLPHSQSLLAGFKGHHRIQDMPTYHRGQVLGPDVQALAHEATPIRKQQSLHYCTRTQCLEHTHMIY